MVLFGVATDDGVATPGGWWRGLLFLKRPEIVGRMVLELPFDMDSAQACIVGNACIV